jgi:fused signal recognition particle receptor
MIKWFKRNQESSLDEQHQEDGSLTTLTDAEPVVDKSKQGLLIRLKQGLSKTRHQLGDGLASLLLGKKEISADLLSDLETLLVSADLGIDVSERVLNELTQKVTRAQLKDGDALYAALNEHLQRILTPVSVPLIIERGKTKPFVILMVGVNGAGKTTTIGKLARQFQQAQKKVMLAAGDTFRAAAVEQLQVWGARNHIPVIAQHSGADSASVIFDAFTAAKARDIDVLIADTAGRLQTQNNLMDELKKIKRVIQKIDPDAPHEVMLVLDASIGQNALNQAREFHQAVGVTGISMTKLDGTAKGGIIFAIANELALPFRYIGIGEGVDDLRPFDAEQFVKAIFHDDRT